MPFEKNSYLVNNCSSMILPCGTYTLNVAEMTVTHHVEGSLAAGWVGGDQLRYFEFVDDRLVLKTPPMRTADGTRVVNTLVWRRA